MRALILLLLLLGSAPAYAQIGGLGGTSSSGGGGAACSGYTGPIDLAPGPLFWGGLRAASCARRGTVAVNVCNPSDAACADLSTDITTGQLIVTTIGGSNCAVVTCTVKIIYDQSGNGRDISQTTIASRPVLVVSCVTSLPCWQFSANGFMTEASTLTQAQPLTFSTVAERTGAFTSVGLIGGGGCSNDATFYYNSSANQVVTYEGSLNGTATASDSAWHNMQTVFTGVVGATGAVYDIDTTITSVNLAASIGFQGCSNSGIQGIIIGDDVSGLNPATDKQAEFGVWGSQLSNTVLNNIDANQHSFWGTGL